MITIKRNFDLAVDDYCWVRTDEGSLWRVIPLDWVKGRPGLDPEASGLTLVDHKPSDDEVGTIYIPKSARQPWAGVVNSPGIFIGGKGRFLGPSYPVLTVSGRFLPQPYGQIADPTFGDSGHADRARAIAIPAEWPVQTLRFEAILYASEVAEIDDWTVLPAQLGIIDALVRIFAPRAWKADPLVPSIELVKTQRNFVLVDLTGRVRDITYWSGSEWEHVTPSSGGAPTGPMPIEELEAAGASGELTWSDD